MVAETTLPEGWLLPQTGENKTSETAGETTPDDDRLVRWEVVAIANGLTAAAIIRGRLESEGIPARVNQEPAGVALGVTVGLLGQAQVLVPESLAHRALALLSQPVQGPVGDENDE